MPDRSLTDSDERYLRLACRLARKAAGRTSPNPMVGAVLVRGGKKIIASGFHRIRRGRSRRNRRAQTGWNQGQGSHALHQPGTLQPLRAHAPCSDALISAGIKKVVAGMKDPNPLVAGRGFRQLRRAGIEVRVGLLAQECQVLNEAFAKYITRGLPFVTLKLAASLDGKIAAMTGDARWISSEDSRHMVHQLRNQVDAVITGVGTVIADDPQLTCRIPNGRDPWRVILDSRLRISLSAELLRQRDPEKNIIVTGDHRRKQKSKRWNLWVRGFGG